MLTVMGGNAHNWVGLNSDRRTSVKAFRRQIVIIFSAYNVETMAKRFKTIRKWILRNLGQEIGRGAQRCKA
jgi:hypothetical protein